MGTKGYRFVVFLMILTITVCVAPLCAYAGSFAVTSPWVYQIVSFIGGEKQHIRSLSKWDKNGKVQRVLYPRSVETIIALNIHDARLFGIQSSREKLHFIFDTYNVNDEFIMRAFYDPAVLPFIAQRVMNIIAETDEKRYRYYQRRLAEFQSRINSTLDIGRHLMSDIGILDLTVNSGVWVQATANKLVKPPPYIWQEWCNGNTAALNDALQLADEKEWLVITDAWTPNIIREQAEKSRNYIFISPPENGADFFAYLHEMIMTLWNSSKQK